MKKFSLSLILAVLLVSPAFAGKLFELTSDLNDSIVAAVDPHNLPEGQWPEHLGVSQFGAVFNFTSEQISYITSGAVADRQDCSRSLEVKGLKMALMNGEIPNGTTFLIPQNLNL